MKLAILLIAALLAGTCECAASCASVERPDEGSGRGRGRPADNREPPCHHDKQAPSACSHELVLDRIHAPTTHDGFEACGAIETPLADGRGWELFRSRLQLALGHDRRDALALPPLRI